jgi:hypothetical protein
MTYLGSANTTLAGRVWKYINAMFPLQVRIPINFLNFSIVYTVAYALLTTGPIPFSWKTLVGALTVQILWLLIRVLDEAKDFESDVELARQGDPRFMNRPLVTGEVLLSDINTLKWWLLAVVVVMNAATQSFEIITGLAIAAFYLGLTSKWLFVPNIKDHIILVYLTHMPNVLVIIGYSLCVALDASHSKYPNQAVVAICLALWFTVGAYEFAYKIRQPDQETKLLTYSKILGFRTASSVCGILVLASGVLYSYAIREVGQLQISILLLTVSAFAALPCCECIFTGMLRRSLTSSVGAYWYFALVACTAAALLQKGVVWI